MLPTEEARLRRRPPHHCAPWGCAPTHAICWRPRNPHRPRPTKQRPSSPRFPPYVDSSPLPRRLRMAAAPKLPRNRVSRITLHEVRAIRHTSPPATLRSALPIRVRPLPRYRGSEPSSRASCGLGGVARHADFSSVGRSTMVSFGGWNGFRKRLDQDQPPQSRNPRSARTVWCLNEATSEGGSERESLSDTKLDNLIQSAKAARVASVISN